MEVIHKDIIHIIVAAEVVIVITTIEGVEVVEIDIKDKVTTKIINKIPVDINREEVEVAVVVDINLEVVIEADVVDMIHKIDKEIIIGRI